MVRLLLVVGLLSVAVGAKLGSFVDVEDVVSQHVSQHAAGSQSTSVTLAALDKMTRDMIASAVEGEQVPEAVRDAIKIIKDFIGRMYGMYKNETQCVDERIDKSCVESFQTCEDQYDHQKLSSLWQVVATTRTTHAQCRVSQCDYLKSQVTLCVSWYNYRTKPAAKVPDCIRAQGYLSGAYGLTCWWDEFMDGEPEYDDWETKLDLFEECAEDSQQHWLFEMWSRYQQCLIARSGGTEVMVQCNNNQTAFENAYCLFAADHQAVCTTRTSCYSHAKTTCDAVCVEEKESGKARCADNVTGTRLLCLLEVFDQPTNEAKGTKYDECVGADYSEQMKYWEIECPRQNPYPPVPVNYGPYPTCEVLPIDVPCSSGWQFEEYYNNGWYSCVNVTYGTHMPVCQSCDLA